jgi:tRNA pseudouridine55 synthase
MELDPEGEILLLDKPLDWTSFDVVKRVRWTFNVAKVGHAGTLDPKATGLLIVCTGRKTKTIDSFMGLEKEYEGTMELGVRTPSFDSETEVTERRPYEGVGREEIERVVSGFVGKQLQTPPMYSANKHHGRPLYKLARKGKVVDRAPKVVDVMGFDILHVENPVVQFRVVCSKGTYVRSLVDDVGTKLGCGATLRSLRRTRIGGFHVRDAVTIEELENARRSPAQSSRVA